jgi:hypothetical protein
MAYSLKLEPLAKSDIQQEIDYYNSIQNGLGKRFYKEVKSAFQSIKKNPFYQIRYDQIHCVPLKIFPSMIHFTVDEINKVAVIRAVINTNQSPDKTYLKI